MRKTYTTPVLNLNGSNGKDLLDEMTTAWDKLVEAREAIVMVTVHGRDFQTQSDGSLLQARLEQHEAIFHLDGAIDWVEANLDSVRDQLSARGDI